MARWTVSWTVTSILSEKVVDVDRVDDGIIEKEQAGEICVGMQPMRKASSSCPSTKETEPDDDDKKKKRLNEPTNTHITATNKPMSREIAAKQENNRKPDKAHQSMSKPEAKPRARVSPPPAPEAKVPTTHQTATTSVVATKEQAVHAGMGGGRLFGNKLKSGQKQRTKKKMALGK